MLAVLEIPGSIGHLLEEMKINWITGLPSQLKVLNIGSIQHVRMKSIMNRPAVYSYLTRFACGLARSGKLA